MADGTGLIPFRETYPSRYADVGICEEHAVGLAAGLAAGGKRPVFAIYSTFLQRALDQVIIDVALPKLNVILCVDRAGIVGADGATHNGSFDLVYLRMIPNMHIICPSSANELASALHTALALGGPFAIRYPREACEPLAEDLELEIMELGKSQTVRTGDDLAILAFGNMVTPALKAAEALSEQGIEARVVNMRWAKPIDLDAVRSAAETKLVVTLEDGCLLGGVGEAVATEVARLGTKTPVLTLGIPDQFVPHGSISEIHHELGLDAAGIVASINEQLERPAAS
jgi:1-deoxy-D-xylulose-5-phosphate synthase